MHKVENFPDLKKDLTTGGVVNTNLDSYESYKLYRAKLLMEQSEKATMTEEINNMKNDINDIKSMLKTLLGKP